MRKITLWILAFVGCLQMQAQVFTTDTCLGTLGSAVYGPMNSVATAGATNRIAVVYQASGLTMLAGQTLTSTYFRRLTASGSMLGNPNFKIYLKEVAFTDFGDVALDWATATTGAVLVYDSNPISAVGTTAGWKSFPMSTSFLYSGTQNLAVFMEYTNPIASTSLTWFYEYGSPCVDTDNDYTTKYSNNTSGTLPTSLATNNFRRPQIGFDFTNTCAAPTNLVVSNITTSSASFDWNAGGTETQWEYAVVPASSGIPTSTTSTSTSETLVTTLNPATAYKIFVRSSCGTDAKSHWIVSNTFITQCVDVTSFSENFDTYSTGTTSMPICWNKIGTGLAYVQTGGVLPGTAPNRFYMNTSATTFIHAILPSVSNLSANTHRLKFKAYATTNNKVLEVGYQTDILNASSFVLLETIALPGTTPAIAQEFIVEPFGVPVGVKNLILRSSNGSATTLYLDDVVWETTPTCPDVSQLSYLNALDTSVTLNWQAGGTETAWQYAVGNSELLNPSTLTPVDVTGGLPTANITNLTANSSYKVWVRSNCTTGGVGAWIGPLLFSTQCAAVTAFSENFDTSATGTTAPLTDCWKRAGNGTSYLITGGVFPGSAPNRLYMSANGTATTPTQALVIMPLISNLQANTHRLKFKAYCTTTGKTIEVGYLSDLNDLSSFVSIDEFNLPGTTPATATEFIAEPFGVPAGIGNLVFRNSATTGLTTLYIDDVIWESTPTCPDVTEVKYSNLLDTSITLSWIAGGVETAWQYAYGVSTLEDPSTLTPVDVTGTPTANIINLTAFTSYKVWVRSNCGTGGFGAWIGPLLFTTQCSPVTTFSENFDTSLTGATAPFTECWQKIGNGTVNVATGGIFPGSAPNRLFMSANGTLATPTEAFAIMPLVSNLQANTHRLKFKAYCSTTNKTIEVGYMTNLSDVSSFISLQQFDLPGTTPATATEFILEPFGVPAGIGNLVFRNNAPTGSTLAYIDDVVWELTPTCADVTELKYTNLLDTSLTLNWLAGGSETAWQYAYGDIILEDPSTLTPINVNGTPTANVTNLTAFTSYKFWVRSNCAAGGFGVWIGPLIVKTQCAGVTSFFENFDTSATGSGATVPFTDCWQKAGNGTVYIATGGVAPGTAPNRLYMSANGTAATPTEAFAIMPLVSNLQANTHRLKFKAYCTTANKTIEVGYLPDLTDTSNFISLEQFNLPGTTAATAIEFILEPFEVPAGVNNLVFRNSAATGTTTLYIDDVVWEQIPSCPDLTVINFTDFNSVSATLTWEPGGSETEWQYVYGATTVTDPTTLIADAVTVSNIPTATIAGLAPSTSYNVWIRSKCGTNVFGNWPQNPVVVTTSCAPVTQYSENFDTLATGTASPMPTCWTKFGTTGTTYITTASTTPNSAPNRLYLFASATASTISTVVLPPVSNLQLGTHRLKFKAYASTVGKEIEIGYYTSAGLTNSFTVLESIPLPSTTQAATQEIVYIPEFVPAGIESLVLRNNAVAFTGTTAMYIDDVVWEPIPACFDITEAQADVLSSTATDITWNLGGSETAWQYVYAQSTVTDPTTLTPVDVTNVPFASLTNLTANTNYNYWIRSNCGTAGFGNWSALFTFKTDCVSTTAFSENFDSYTATGSANPLPDCWRRGGNALSYITTGGALPGTPPNRLYMTASGTTGTQSLAIMPPLSNLQAGTHTLKFKAYASTANRFVEIGYLTDSDDISTFEILTSFSLPGTAASTAVSFSYAPTTIPAGVTYLAFRNVGIVGGATTLYIDDVVWEPSPTCPNINQAFVTGITSNTANINWTPGATETTWEYVYGLSTVTDPNTLTPVSVSTNPSAVISNLLPTTAYKVWVRAVCGTTFGTWSTPATFTTQCSNFPAPFLEDFSTFLPNCWSTSSAGTIATGPTTTSGGSFFAGGFLNNGTTGAARANFYLSNGVGWLITPLFDVSAAGQYTFSFDYGITTYEGTAPSNMGSDDTIQIAMSQDAGVTWTEIQLFNAASNIGNTSTTFTHTFAASATPVKFAIITNEGTVSDLEDYNFYVDNVKLETVLGNEAFDSTSFTAYPNPVKNMLNLSYSQNISEVSVFNLLGQQVINKSLNATKGQVDMSYLASGTYLVKVTTEKGIKALKVIKE